MTREVRRNAKGEKLYPFSMIKNGHNIELAYNHQWIICHEMEDGEREWDDKAFEALDMIKDLYDRYIMAGIVWVTGADYAQLRDMSVWAECYRDSRQRL